MPGKKLIADTSTINQKNKPLLPKDPLKRQKPKSKQRPEKILLWFEGFLDDMFTLYEDKNIKQALQDALTTDDKSKKELVKEFFSLAKKYFDYHAQKMKMEEARSLAEATRSQGSGITNVFIIKGLNEQEKISETRLDGLYPGDQETTQGVFNPVGLNS